MRMFLPRALLALLVLVSRDELAWRPIGVLAQFPRDSAEYSRQIASEEAALTESLLASNPAVNTLLNPSSALLSKDSVVFDYPLYTTTVINIIMDPCRGLAPNCCMNVYGVAEYPSLLRANLETERVLKYSIIGNESEVAINYNLIHEDWSAVPPEYTRGADDNTVFNTTCTGLGVPYSFCQARNFAYVRSDYRPACLDYNQTLNAAAGCTDPMGNTAPFCVPIAYSPTTFIPQCAYGLADPHCGTFLEIHRAHGTPYADENFVIASVAVPERNVSGFSTVVMPLFYNNTPNKILCAYTESFIRVGTLVYILPSAPVCCCPQPYKAVTRIGSWQCPVGDTGAGSTAYVPKNLAQKLLMESRNNAYPYCPNDVTSKQDLMMCSHLDAESQRNYLEKCTNVIKRKNLLSFDRYGSSDLAGWDNSTQLGPYDGFCPYYPGCALTLNKGLCVLPDTVFSFIGQVGIVTAFDSVSNIPTVDVSFNDGRTSYRFLQSDVKIETYRSMFEVWWTIKTPTGNVVQKRKGFNITEPTCTYDSVNKDYFPYAIIQQNDDGSLKTNPDGTYIYVDSSTTG